MIQLKVWNCGCGDADEVDEAIKRILKEIEEGERVRPISPDFDPDFPHEDDPDPELVPVPVPNWPVRKEETVPA